MFRQQVVQKISDKTSRASCQASTWIVFLFSLCEELASPFFWFRRIPFGLGGAVGVSCQRDIAMDTDFFLTTASECQLLRKSHSSRSGTLSTRLTFFPRTASQPNAARWRLCRPVQEPMALLDYELWLRHGCVRLFLFCGSEFRGSFRRPIWWCLLLCKLKVLNL